MLLRAIYIQRIVASFLPHRVRRELRELYLSTTLMQLAATGLALFETIYLYTLGYNLATITGFWLEVYVGYFFLIPLGAKLTRRFGAEALIASGSLFYVVYLAALYAIRDVPVMLFIAPLLYAVQKMLYWPAFHADFAKNVNQKTEGELVGDFQILVGLAAIAGPIIAGFVVEYFGFLSFFILGSFVIALSNWPMLRTKESVTPKTFSYLRPYERLFSGIHRRQLFAHLGYGEELVGLAIWPIFVFVIIGNYLSSGVVVGLATTFTILLTYFFGKVSDRLNRRHILRIGGLGNAVLWLLAILPQARWSIVLLDTSFRVAKNSITIPLVAMSYHDAQTSDPLDEVLLYEMGLILGKVFAAILILVALLVFDGFSPFFVVASVMSLLYLWR